MVRGKVVLKRIENKINRQVTFSKRRQGLFKKAQELSVLCDAQVAVIVSSSRGKLFDFASPDDVKQILERYHQCCTPQRNDTENEKQSLCEEVSRLKVKYESLQRSQRHFLGEDLEKLRLKELDNLEKQLDRNLSRARQRKTQMMIDQLEALRRKENDLTEMNKKITSELEEREKHGGDDDEEEAVIQGRPGRGGPGSTNIATANADPSGSQQEPTLHL